MTFSCVYVLEEKGKQKDFFPLTYTRNISDLKIGSTTLKEKIERYFPKSSIFFIDNETSLPQSKDVLLLNSRVFLDPSLKKIIENSSVNQTYFCKDQWVFSRLNSISPVFLEKKEIQAQLIFYPWDIIKLNGLALKYDFDDFLKKKKPDLKNIELVGSKKNFYRGKNVTCYGTVVINATQGPVFIDDDVVLKAPLIIEGPAFIGKGSLIDAACIRPNTTIGPNCKISGEVADSIFYSYCNKRHDGFIGHSYIGSWVNMGAMTTNSDLKNNYQPVKVKIGDEFILTHEIKVGCFVGDYSTFGIGSMIPTGAVIGAGVNVFGAGLLEKFYPCFTWADNSKKEIKEYEFKKAIETFAMMHARRNVAFDADLLLNVFEKTKGQRENIK